jgi:hypothetical protein
MGTRLFGVMSAVLLVHTLLGCDESKKEATKGNQAAVPSTAPSAAVPEKAAEPSPEGCKPSGNKPTRLATVLGDAFGFAGDATHLYCATWQMYGGRGDVTKIRKDGQGSEPLAGLKLEPRGLALDKDTLYFTAGIRLNSVPKTGGSTATLNEQFSSQRIAVDDKSVYGVPGNYGPYDRLAKIPKKGGETIEIASAKRPKVGTGVNGYNSVALDESGIYVADSGNGQILRFSFEPGKPRRLATGLKKPFDLAIDGSNVYFSLAGGDLMMVPKAGGKSSKLAARLTEDARIAADAAAVYTTQAAKEGRANLVKVTPSDGSTIAVVEIAPTHLVSALSLDQDCVYWVERVDATKSEVYALPRTN